jgi:hypothetical protein
MASGRSTALCVIAALLLPGEASARALIRGPVSRGPALAAPSMLPLLAPALVLGQGSKTEASAAGLFESLPVPESIAAIPELPSANVYPAAAVATGPQRRIAPAPGNPKKASPRRSLERLVRGIRRSPAKGLNLYFDAASAGPSAHAVAGRAVPRARRLLNPAVAAPAPRQRRSVERTPALKRRGRFKTGVMAGAGVAAGAAVWYGTASPALALNAAFTIGAVTASLWAANRVVRWAFKRGPPRSRSFKKGAILGLALGALAIAQPQLMMTAQFKSLDAAHWAWRETAPESWSGGNADAVFEVLTETRKARSLPADFGDAVVEAIEKNPEGRRVLKTLRDRSGTLRLPDFYVGELGAGTAARYIAPYDAIFVEASSLKRLGLTVEQVREDPAAAEKLILSVETTMFHELFHAHQFRTRLLVPGMLEKFPTQLHKVLALEIEYETHVAEQRYVHEKLKADPNAELSYWALSEYEDFLYDLDQFLGGIDGAYAYRWFSPIDSRYYRRVLARERAAHDARAVEGYLNLARREADESPGRARYYLQKAQARAERAGLPVPEKY